MADPLGDWEKAAADLVAEAEAAQDDRPKCRSCKSPLEEKAPRDCRYKSNHVCGARHGRDAIEPCTKPRWRCVQDRKEERDQRFAEDPTSVPLTARNVLDALDNYYQNLTGWPSWTGVEEFRVGIGKQHDKIGDQPSTDDVRWERRIDYLAISTWPRRGPEIIVHEVKVSRADWLEELKHPEKREDAMTIATRFYIVAPPAIVNVDEVPEGCGLLEVEYTKYRRAYVHVVVEAPYREPGPIHWRTFASLALHVRSGARPRTF